MMEQTLLLAVGSLVGGFARYGLAGFVYNKLGTGFPSGTLAVNLLGCFLIGLLDVLAREKFLLSPPARLLLMTGFCGAFTTFSTFILETGHLLEDGEFLLGFGNVLISVVAGFVLFKAGAILAKLV